MDIELKRAISADLEALAPLTAAFHAEEGIEMDDAARRKALASLLENESWGAALRIESAGTLISYVILSYGFALCFGGRDSYVDEIYVIPEARGQGAGRAALSAVLSDLRARGFNAVHLEVAADNHSARRVYAAEGFEFREHYHLMTAMLD